MKKLLCAFGILFTCMSVKSEQLDVIFLGHDSKNHNSRLNHKKLIPEFLRRGINMTYSEDINILNQKTLEKYDALILYANYAKWSPEQEKALINFVEGGKGFIPLHCASWCFHGSSAFTKLVGARFSHHGQGWFTANWVKEKKINGVKEFITHDETYVHKEFNPDRTDLQVRIDGKHKEPWTWIRRQGKGRIFYTAYGHDGPVWENKQFHNLVASGVIWAAGKKGIKASQKFPDFKYVEDKEGYLTNYERRRFRHKRQLPLTPKESAKCNVLPDGFKAVLFAAEPNIVNPIDMCWDDKGRLFVAETVDYPNDMQKIGKGNDRIKICEDTDGDGKADKFTVFAKGLSIPTSICFANGGIIVAHAPDMLFLKDTNGDDKADKVEILNSGWGTGDTHAGPSNLQYGLDNKIYGSVGYSGGPNRVKNGIFRMNLDGSNIENISNFNNNTWGLGISEDFELFGSTANNNPAFHIAIPYPYYDNAGIRKQPAAAIFDSSSFYPLIPIRQVDFFNKYTAGAGFNLYTARNFPEKYWNSSAFIGGPSGRLLGQYFIEANGSSYKAINADSLLASFDQYTSPIQAKTGPDGNVWMLDWSNLIIQHNPTPSIARGGFKSHNGKGNAHWNPLRDKKHGRVYKIVYKQSKNSKSFDLSSARIPQLIEALKSNNMMWRQHAQMKLIESKDKNSIMPLTELLANQEVDSKGLNTTVIHALWTLKGLNAIKPGSQVLQAVSKCLSHPSPGVRKNAVRVLPKEAVSSSLIIKSGILKDRDSSVLRMALLAASELPNDGNLGQELTKIRNRLGKDFWLTESWKICYSAHASLPKIIATMKPRASNSTISSNNLFTNSSFEAIQDNKPNGWTFAKYKVNDVEFAIDDKVSKSGKYSIRISSKNGADAGAKFFKDLDPGRYKLSGYIKTTDLKKVNRGVGACLNIEGKFRMIKSSKALLGTNEWQKFSCTFEVKERGRFGFNALYGGWGQAAGIAWYDDLRLTKIKDNDSELLRILSKKYFESHPREVTKALKSILSKDTDETLPILEGLSESKIKLNTQHKEILKSLINKFSGESQAYVADFARLNGIQVDKSVKSVTKDEFKIELLKGNSAKGKAQAALCFGCHGADLNGDTARKSPSLAGQNDWYIVSQLQKYKAGIRGNATDANAMTMQAIAKTLSSQQMADVAAYLQGSVKSRVKTTTLSGNIIKGAKVYQSCIPCHGSDAKGISQFMSPKLTGLSDWYLLESLQKFKARERGNHKKDLQGQLMMNAVTNLSKQEMIDVVAYILSLQKK